jgi:hypothetical protein
LLHDLEGRFGIQMFAQLATSQAIHDAANAQAAAAAARGPEAAAHQRRP